MKKKRPTYEELEARLIQAEETLRAIRSGEIDVIIGEKCPFILRAKDVEDKLRETQEALDLAISGSNAGLWDLKFNPEDPYKIPDEIYISPRLKGFIGFSEDEFPNSISAWHSRIHPEDLELVKKVAQEHLEGEREIHEVEYRIYHKDGSIRWIHSRGKIKRDKDGVPKRWTGIDWDITEQKKREEELRASEDKYRALVEKSLQGILIVQDFRIVYANERCAEITGYTLEELLSLPTEKVIKLVHPEDRALVWGRFKDRLQGKDVPSQYEYRGIRKDGSIRWLEMFSSLIEYHGKSAVQAAIVDITERKQAEEELWKSEESYKNLIETARDVIFTLSPYGVITSLNSAFNVITGWSRADWVGKPFNPLVHQDDLPLAMEKFKYSLQGELSESFELRIRTMPGGYVTGEFVLAPQIRNGKVVNILGIARDITERKRTEESLRESEERYRTAIENSNDGVSITKEGLHLYVNKKFLEIFGYENAEEILGKPISITIHPDDRDRVMEISLKRERGEVVPTCYDFKGVKKNGDIVYIEVSVARVHYLGEIVSLAYLRDITERKRMEQEMFSLQEQLRQAQKMEAIGRLAGGVAHDFNNILSVIKGTCQLSLLDLREGDPLYNNLKEIDRAADRAADLTRQLLAFSRKQVMEMRVVDLNDVVKGLKKMLRRIIGEDIELVTYLSDGLGRVRVDPSQMEQAIINIVVNARDAMPQGGKLTIETANVELDEEYARRHIAVKPGSYVMLSISDTGVGMTKEVQERVFEPFFTTKEMGRGTGLGLSTVYGIVKQSGGNIWVYSEVGRGSTFKIYLPRVEEALEEGVREEVIGEVPRGSETILVVEDEEVVRKLAVRLLKKQGYKVLEAPDGGQAFILCEKYQDPIHLILTDVVMPGMSGRELVERLQRIHPEVRVLYMSGYTDNVILHHGILEEGVAFIQKPFTLETLARKVREVLDR